MWGRHRRSSYRVDGHQPASPQLHAAMDRHVSGRTHRYWRCVAFRPTGRPGTAQRSTSGSSGGVTSCSTSWCASSTIAKGTGSAGARYETRRQELVSALEQVSARSTGRTSTPGIPGRPGRIARASPRDDRFRPGPAGRCPTTLQAASRRVAHHVLSTAGRHRGPPRAQRRRQVDAHQPVGDARRTQRG